MIMTDENQTNFKEVEEVQREATTQPVQKSTSTEKLTVEMDKELSSYRIKSMSDPEPAEGPYSKDAKYRVLELEEVVKEEGHIATAPVRRKSVLDTSPAFDDNNLQKKVLCKNATVSDEEGNRKTFILFAHETEEDARKSFRALISGQDF